MNEQSRIRSAAPGAFVAYSGLPFGPRINFAPPDDLGGTGGAGGASEEATAAALQAAEKNAAEKAAADKVAAEAAEAAKSKEGVDKVKSDKEAELLREVMDKKAKLKDAEAAIAAREAELAKFNGIDIEEVKALLAEKSARERRDAEAKGEFDRVKQMMVDEHNKAVEILKNEITTLKELGDKRAGVIDTLTVGNAFSTSLLISEQLTLSPTKARTIYGSHFDIVDGRVVGYDKPLGTEGRTPLVDASGNNLPFEDALKRIVDADPERDQLYRVKLQPGAQSKTQQAAKAATAEDKSLYGASRIRLALSN